MQLLKKLFKKQIEPAQIRPTSPSPEPAPPTINEVTPEALKVMLQKGERLTIIDLRQTWEYASGHIPGAVNIPLNRLTDKLGDIPKDHSVIIQCCHGFTSLNAAGYLIMNGWEADKIASLSGGISGWVTSQGMESLKK